MQMMCRYKILDTKYASRKCIQKMHHGNASRKCITEMHPGNASRKCIQEMPLCCPLF
jgi:hypothetical protein